MSKLNNDFNVHRSIDCLNLNILKENINSNSPPPVLKNNRFTKNLLRRRSSNLVADLASIGNHENFYTYELIQQIAQYLLDRTTVRPKIGIICGSGLGNLVDVITDSVSFPYHEIPHFPISTVAGHVGKLVFGNLDGVPIMCMQGRFHYYEGYPLWKCSMPVRVMKLVGVTHLIVTNAAGGLNPKYRAGDIMLMKDHINFLGFAGNNPLQGVNDERFGPRFPAMNRAYNASLRKAAQKIAKEMGIEKFVREGVYAVVGGPNFETIAECRMLRICGVDAVGMSTVHEVLTAQHCDMKVFAFSLITNKCVTDYESMAEATHEENIDTGIMREGVIKKLVTNVVRHISNNDLSQPTKNGSSVTNKTSHTFSSST